MLKKVYRASGAHAHTSHVHTHHGAEIPTISAQMILEESARSFARTRNLDGRASGVGLNQTLNPKV